MTSVYVATLCEECVIKSYFQVLFNILQLICIRGVGTMGTMGAQAPQHFNWGPCPCSFEHWQLLIKVANDQLTKKHVNLCTCLLSKLQRNV